MTAENTNKLFTDFNKLFMGRKEPISQNLMSFGFECGNGWFDLIYDLCLEIYKYCDENQYPYPKATQVKQKFGSLRFSIPYSEFNNPEDTERMNTGLSMIISKYEYLSCETCELCGKKGKIVNENSCYTALCNEHQD